MIRTNRSAAHAAAFLTAVFGLTYAGPAHANEATPVLPAQPSSTRTILPEPPAVVPAQPADAAPAPAASEETLTPVQPPLVTEPAELPQPAVPVRRSLAELVDAHASSKTRNAEHDCLAGAVYFESKGEPLKGQLAVAEVVLNRARSGKFPKSVCGVVKQPRQFSFVRGGRIPPIARSSPAWRKAVAVARIAMDDLADGDVPKALFFHATYVSPRWRGLTRIATVGNHVFYR